MVVVAADTLSESDMQAFARETNLSETAFILNSSVADVRARYFTPAEEIPLAGHPTLAVSRALIEVGRIRSTQRSYSLELKAGVVTVELEADSGATRFTMAQRPPRFLRTYNPDQVAPAFGLTPSDLLPDVPIQTVSTGTPQLMIAVRSIEAVRRAQLDFAAYAQLKQSGDFFSPHVFCLEGMTPHGRTFARHFGLPPDTYEDPFTGSATGGMGAYLWRYGLIDQPRFIAEQGHAMQRPGHAFVEVVGTPDSIQTVKVGGHTALVMQGMLTL